MRRSIESNGEDPPKIALGGKYVGLKFDQILEKDAGYVEWCKRQLDARGWVKDLVDWANDRDNGGGRREKDSQTIARSNTKISVSSADKLSFMMVSNEKFTIVSITLRGSTSVISGFLGRELFDHLRGRYVTESVMVQNYRFTAFNVSDYPILLGELRDIVSVEVEAIPKFCLLLNPNLRALSDNLGLRSVRLSSRIYKMIVEEPDKRTRSLYDENKIAKHLGERLKTSLHPFQTLGVDFALKRNGRILIADEMGLGKTLQALAISAIYHEEWPLLIICPSAVKFQWRDQALAWLPHLLKSDEVHMVKCGKDKISRSTRVVISSYDIITMNSKFRYLPGSISDGSTTGTSYQVVIADESHYIKSGSSQRAKAVVPLIEQARRAILLSGTPALNKPSEIYQQFNALLPGVATFKDFADRYCDSKVNPWSRGREYFGSRMCAELNNLLTGSIMIRRLKSEVAKELPAKQRNVVPLELNKTELNKLSNVMTDLAAAAGGKLDNLMQIQMSDDQTGSTVREQTGIGGVPMQFIAKTSRACSL
eukprot:GHVH01007887.1.p1 GENE.GHVH01007887.1~~GHVH01007887.1.p1  ORF type:complete len:538 (-),score=61.50 GHVH01007887.1:16-1629(-)